MAKNQKTIFGGIIISKRLINLISKNFEEVFSFTDFDFIHHSIPVLLLQLLYHTKKHGIMLYLSLRFDTFFGNFHLMYEGKRSDFFCYWLEKSYSKKNGVSYLVFYQTQIKKRIFYSVCVSFRPNFNLIVRRTLIPAIFFL